MHDVNEVVNGLEMSYKYSNVDENNTLVPQWIVLHAIDLLKAQEARVMTLEELVAWQKQPITARDPIFVEYRKGKGFGAPHWAQDNFGFNVASCKDNYRSGMYGMLIRCWTSRPDEKRMVETPWN